MQPWAERATPSSLLTLPELRKPRSAVPGARASVSRRVPPPDGGSEARTTPPPARAASAPSLEPAGRPPDPRTPPAPAGRPRWASAPPMAATRFGTTRRSRMLRHGRGAGRRTGQRRNRARARSSTGVVAALAARPERAGIEHSERRRTRSAHWPRLCRLRQHGRPRGRNRQLTDRRGFRTGVLRGDQAAAVLRIGRDRRLHAWHSGEKHPHAARRR